MSQADQEKKDNSEEISLRDIIDGIKRAIAYLKRKWLPILIVAIVGAFLGLGYSILKKPTYTAVCTFVLEDAKSGGGLGQYAGLASLAGIDIGSGGGGIFQGDNIIELYKSRLMIEKALLSVATFNSKKELLIDRYVDYNELRKKWKKEQLDTIHFSGDPDKFNRKQDSLITDIVDMFNKKILSVSKPDKKLSIIRVEVIAKDELFAKEFTNKLVEKVNDFYIQTKTKKAYQNVQILQKQADSVRRELNSSISGVASAIDATPNANPEVLTLRVPSQKRQIDVQASTAVYSEIVKNLEISKLSLRQEMPLIQVIDKPVLPLYEDKIGKVKGIILGTIMGAIFTMIALIGKRLFEKI